ncbi:hypothetical protein RHSIM_Rhsim10G0097900 [Rhododendron simsii]|uniref:Myb/SANT-like domain-containing protein n=1 Tax=Rhododendron simsii TaxID=118357 RepID=A0A834LCQ3_RHOSS|nr:hypothetical protein RHSIM_Rhsim10G0097900 [Rhododendron simsii]
MGMGGVTETVAKMEKFIGPSKPIFVGAAGVALFMLLWSFSTSTSFPSMFDMAKITVLPGKDCAATKDCATVSDQGHDLGHDLADKTFYDDPTVSYEIGYQGKNWDEKRREWLKHHPSFAIGVEDRIFVLTGSQPGLCEDRERGDRVDETTCGEGELALYGHDEHCSGLHWGYTAEQCYGGMEKALNFADNQVLRNYGFVRPDLMNTSSLHPLPFGVEEAVEEQYFHTDREPLLKRCPLKPKPLLLEDLFHFLKCTYMDNDEEEVEQMELMHAFVALQYLVASINFVCALFVVVMHVALENPRPRFTIARSPHPFRIQLDNLNKLFKGMPKKSDGKAARRFWNKREEEFLLNTMKDLVIKNAMWKLDCGMFKGGFFKEYQDVDRKQYNLLQDMIQSSGFGWDDSEKMVLVHSDDVWKNYVRRVSDAKGMRNKPFAYYDDWLTLFGKDRANGNLAEGPVETVAAMVGEKSTTDQEYYSPVMDFSLGGDTELPLGRGTEFSVPHNTPESAAPSSSIMVGKKRARADDEISKGLSNMVEAFGTFFKDANTTMAEIAHRVGYAHDLSNTRGLVNDALTELPLDCTDRLKAASMIVDKPQRVDLFFSLKKEEDKVEWVNLLLSGLV